MDGLGQVEMPAENEKRRHVAQDRVAAGGAGQQAPDHAVGRLAVGRRQQEGELVAADAERAIGGAAWSRDQPADGGSSWSPAAWPIGVVDPLQVVEVDDRERERAAVRGRRVGDLAGELLLEGAVVAEAGQRVDARVEARPVVGGPRLAEVALEVLDDVGRPGGWPSRDEGREARRRRHREHEGKPADEPRHEEAGAAIAATAPNPSARERRTAGAAGRYPRSRQPPTRPPRRRVRAAPWHRPFKRSSGCAPLPGSTSAGSAPAVRGSAPARLEPAA